MATDSEKYYDILKAELEPKLIGFVNDNLKNQDGYFIEIYNERIIKILSVITYVKNNPNNYKEAWERWAREQNEIIKEQKKEIDIDKDLKRKNKIEIIAPEKYIISSSLKKLLDTYKLWDLIIIDELDKKHIGDIKAKEIIFLSCLGRLVKNKKSYSFNDLILSVSSAGKDHLVASVLKLFPKEDYEVYGRTSAKTFNYLHNLEEEPDYTYNGKIIHLKEVSETILNNEVMKEFTSAEEEESWVPIPRQSTKFKSAGVDVLKIRGHPVVFATTATSTPSDEIRNRYNIIGVDESEEQTKRARINTITEYSEEIKNFLANLKMYEVEIPEDLFNFIDKHFPSNKVRYRRDFPKFLDFIRAVTIFNQFNRTGYNTKILRAEPEDYNLARDVFMNAYTKLSDIPLKEVPKRVIKVLQKTDIPLTAKEICQNLKGYIAIQNLYPYLNDLKYKEIIQEVMDKDLFDTPTTKYFLSEEYKENKPFELPIYNREINDINDNNESNENNEINEKETKNEIKSIEIIKNTNLTPQKEALISLNSLNSIKQLAEKHDLYETTQTAYNTQTEADIKGMKDAKPLGN